MGVTVKAVGGLPLTPSWLDDDYVRFPPRWRNVLVPAARPGATDIGMCMYSACKPLPLVAQHGLWLAAKLSRGRLVFGDRERWTPPISREDLTELWNDWIQTFGMPVDGVAIYERLQHSRASLTVMLCAGARSVLIRVRADKLSLVRESAVSTVAATGRPDTFSVPPLVGQGSAAGWHWAAYQTISARPHRPVRRLPDALTAQVTDIVEQVVTRPAGTPEHWRGAHGDLIPWNLRRSHTGTWLIDWEDAAWLPPGADEVYFRAVSAALRPGAVGPLRVPREHREAAAHWASVVRQRHRTAVEARLQGRLESLLPEGR